MTSQDFKSKSSYAGDMLDITGAGNIFIQVREDGKVVWVDVDNVCRLRICQIEGEVEIDDNTQ